MKNTLKDKDLIPAIVYIPKGTVKLKLVSFILNEEKGEEATDFLEYSNIMMGSDLYDSLINGEYYEFEHITYHLTEKGEDILKN